MAHFVDGISHDVQPNACDVIRKITYLWLPAWDADDANLCIEIVGVFLRVIDSMFLYSIWNMHYNLISV